jgi:chaperonin GroES
VRGAPAYEDGDELQGDDVSAGVAANLEAIADYEGNLANLMEEGDLRMLGEEAASEYQIDVGDMSEWLAGYHRAQKATKQEAEAKDYPFKRAANIKFPVLTTACMQFNARAYPAATRSDQPVTARPQGKDPQGHKAARGQRLSSFLNHQLMRECDEWDPGTDKLLMQMPIGGAGFRKVYQSRELRRPVLDFATPDKIVLPKDAPSFDRTPRLTQPVIYYPHEIRRLIDRGDWVQHNWQRHGGSDTQRPVDYLEQQRYVDMDGDGLYEPYIVTVHTETRAVVRIEAGFDTEGLKVTRDGEIDMIVRDNPIIPYYFLPSIDDSPYGLGLGQLLESLGGAINTTLNQILDAAHRQNAGGGFIAQGLRMRGGEVKMAPGQYKFINAPGNDIRNAIHDLKFDGPSMVLFNTLEFLLGAAQDISSVKDVLTGEAPAGQAMGATLALIEQGLAVSSTIYMRFFRGMRRELKRLVMLNERYLDPRIYEEFLDDDELLEQLLGATGSPGAAMQAIGAAQTGANAKAGNGGVTPAGNVIPMQRQQPAQWTPQALDRLMEDFNLRSMDVALGADPKSMTEMQRITRAEFLTQFETKPGINTAAIYKRKMAAAGIENPDELFTEGPSETDEIMKVEKKSEIEVNRTQAMLNKAKAVKETQAAETVRQEGMGKAFERGINQGQVSGGLRGMVDAPGGEGLPDDAGGPDSGGVGGMDEPPGDPPPQP